MARLLRRFRRRTTETLLAAMLGATVLAVTPSTAHADLGAQEFYDGVSHIISDNITTGSNYALQVYNPGTSASMNGFTIRSSGPVSVGVNGWGALQLTDVIISHSGDYALVSDLSGSATMEGGSITTTRVNATNGVYPSACAVLAQRGGTIELRDVTIQAAGTALYADSYDQPTSGPTITASVNGQNISGGTALLNAVGSGKINLTASSGSRLYGIVTISNPATAVANLTLNSGATWTNPGNSILSNLTLNNGIVTFAAPSAGSYKTITINGNLTGSGGVFNLNANLGAGLADLITINGNTSGVYQLSINNQGTAAAARSAVKVVQLNPGATNTASFSGSDIGAYRYGVAQGSTLGGYSGVNSAADYYLYNAGKPSNVSQSAVASSAGSVIAWYGEMNEIRKRMGELRLGRQSSDDFWSRTYATKFNVKPAGAESYTQITHGIELGKDNPQAFIGGKKITGFLVGYGKGDSSLTSGGSDTTDSTYLGAYSSWVRDDGSYFDLIGKYNWFNHKYAAPVLGGGSDSGSYRNQGLGLSAEIGKHIAREDGFFIEPALELSTLWSSSASYTSANGLAVTVPSAHSLQLRLGCTVGKTWQGKSGAARQLYGKLSWVNEYAGNSSVRVDTASFDASLKGHQWVAGVGFVEDSKNHQLYLDAEKSWGNSISKVWGVNAGYRWKL
ncbi:MAG: hypothetical protein H6Q72_2455 [Firmicutes bacterium]|nr:hypothetical protein [Bacillota bacterium]